MLVKKVFYAVVSSFILLSCAKEETKKQDPISESEEISISLEKDLIITVGEKTTFSIEGGNNQTYTLEISNPKIINASIEEKKISVEGKESGEAEIIITSAEKKKIVKVKVRSIEKKEVKVQQISFDKNQEILVAGRSHRLIPTIFPENATNKKLSWKSSDTNILKVDANGNLHTTTKFVGKTATITATTTDGSNISAEITIRITQLATSLEIQTQDVIWSVGTEFQLEANIQPEKASNTLKWSSANPEIASVDDTGKIICKKEGKTTITAETLDVSYLSSSISVTIISQATEIHFDEKEINVSKNTKKQPLDFSFYYNGMFSFKLDKNDYRKKFLKITSSNERWLKIDTENLEFETLYSNGDVTISFEYADGREEPLKGEIKVKITN